MPTISRLLPWVALAASCYPLALFVGSLPVIERSPEVLVALAGLALTLCAMAFAKFVPMQRVAGVVVLSWLAIGVYVGQPPAALAFLLWAAAALAVGASILAPTPSLTPVERATLAFLTGLAVLLALASLVLRLPLHHPTVYALLCIGVCAWRHRVLKELAASLAAQWAETKRTAWPPVVAALAMAAVLVGLYGALGTLTPITAFDDLSFHLRLPYELLVRHRYSFDISQHVWSTAPWAGDLAFAIPFLISQGSEGVKVWVAGSYHAAAAILLLGLLRRRLALAPALLFLLAYLSIPLVLAANHTLHTEGISAALILAVFALWAAARDAGPRPAIAAALLLGLLGSLKSSNLAACLALGLLWLPAFWRMWRERPATGIAIVVALGTAAIPYVAAWVKTGNPLFPLFNGFFRSPYFEPVNFTNALYAGKFGPGLLPSLFLDSGQHLETPLSMAGGLAVFFLLPSALLVALWRGDAQRRCALAIALFYAIVVLSSQQYLRYLFPVMGLATLAISGLWEWPAEADARAQRTWKTWWTALLLLAIGVNTLFMPRVFWQTPLDEVFRSLSPIGRSDYVAKYAAERSLTRIVNQDFGAQATVLYMGDPFGADLHGTPVHLNWFNSAAERRFLAVKDEAGAARFVRESRLTHVITPKVTVQLKPNARAAAQAVENYARAHGAVVASSAGAALIALDDSVVWPRILWSLDAARAGSKVSAKNALSAALPISGGSPVLFEVEGLCDSVDARPSVDLLWLRKGVTVRTQPAFAPCLVEPGQPEGVFRIRYQGQAPRRADGLRVWVGTLNDSPIRLQTAQVRALAP